MAQLCHSRLPLLSYDTSLCPLPLTPVKITDHTLPEPRKIGAVSKFQDEFTFCSQFVERRRAVGQLFQITVSGWLRVGGRSGSARGFVTTCAFTGTDSRRLLDRCRNSAG